MLQDTGMESVLRTCAQNHPSVNRKGPVTPLPICVGEGTQGASHLLLSSIQAWQGMMPSQHKHRGKMCKMFQLAGSCSASVSGTHTLSVHRAATHTECALNSHSQAKLLMFYAEGMKNKSLETILWSYNC